MLDASRAAGVTFFDTADVYGDGRSEALIGAWRRDRPDAEVTVATKMGRRMDQLPENYVLSNFRAWTDRSRRNLGVDTLDLVQLHRPPTAVYSDDEVFDALDTLVEEGVMANYGVSVETTDQALTAIARPNVATVQIILNAFRLKPLDAVLPAAQEAGVGIIARVPLASGLLTGRYTHDTAFAANDHRNFNRHGEAFDQGETFSGVDYDEGVEAAKEFSLLVSGKKLKPATAALGVGGAAAGGVHRDPRRAQRGPGRGERGGRVGRSARQRLHRRDPRALRPPFPRRRPRALVVRGVTFRRLRVW